MKKIFIIAFAILAFVQWLIPVNIIWDREKVLRRGNAFKFQTEPIDPVNPFKGRYVALSFVENSFPVKSFDSLKYNQTVFVSVKASDSGFAKIANLQTSEPTNNADYVKVRITGMTPFQDSANVVYISYPFEEYYMEESRAPRAEKMYRDSARNTQRTYALVKVYNGTAVIEGLYINDRSIEELLK